MRTECFERRDKLGYSRKEIEVDFLVRGIAISAQTGVGKTKTIEALLQLLPNLWRLVTGSDTMATLGRQYPPTAHMSKAELAAFNRTHPELEFDAKCDGRLRDAGFHELTLMESRLCHIMAPMLFPVLLTCDINIRVERRLKDSHKKTREQVYGEIAGRDENDAARYNRLYPGWNWSPQDFELVLDTGDVENSSIAISQKIYGGYLKWFRENESRFRPLPR